MTFAGASMSCALEAEQGNNALELQRETLEQSAPLSDVKKNPQSQSSGVVNSLHGLEVRELLAGCELEIGDARALTAACEVRNSSLAKELRRVARAAHLDGIIGPLVAGSLAFIFGGLLGGLAVYVWTVVR